MDNGSEKDALRACLLAQADSQQSRLEPESIYSCLCRLYHIQCRISDSTSTSSPSAIVSSSADTSTLDLIRQTLGNATDLLLSSRKRWSAHPQDIEHFFDDTSNLSRHTPPDFYTSVVVMGVVGCLFILFCLALVSLKLSKPRRNTEYRMDYERPITVMVETRAQDPPSYETVTADPPPYWSLPSQNSVAKEQHATPQSTTTTTSVTAATIPPPPSTTTTSVTEATIPPPQSTTTSVTAATIPPPPSTTTPAAATTIPPPPTTSTELTTTMNTTAVAANSPSSPPPTTNTVVAVETAAAVANDTTDREQDMAARTEETVTASPSPDT